jgi:hypothetical protein
VAFYRQHGPLPRDAFLAACARSKASLGSGRALSACLADLERQIGAAAGIPVSDSKEEQP